MSDKTVNDFELPSTGNAPFKLSDFSDKILVIYFYPKDNTPGCTTEAQEFRGLHPDFVQAGCAVFGVSRDNLRSHESFKAKQELPFELLSDTEERLCEQFSVIKEKKLYGKLVRGIERSTFVIDRQGVLKREWRNVKAPGHAQEVLNFVKTL